MHTAALSEIELIDRPEVPLIGELAAYWESKRTGRIAPCRADIDPLDLKPHLPHIFMVDVLDGGADFRYRLIGTAIVRGLGRDSTGKRVSELYRDQPDAGSRLHAYFTRGMEARAPVFSRGHVFWVPDSEYRRFAGCLLPLSDDGVSVNILLAELFVDFAGKYTVAGDPDGVRHEKA